jgi:hypothetical protein
MPKTELEKRKGVYIKLNPQVVKALDAVAEMFQCDKVQIVELGLCSVFKGAIEVISEDISGACRCG